MASVPHFISVQISRSFQLGAVVEGVAHLLAQHTVCVVDGVKGDGPQLVRVDLSGLVQHGLVGAHIDDLPHQAAALRVVTHQAALHRHGKLVDERRVHKFRLGGVPAGLRHLVRHLVAGLDAHVVAGNHLLRRGHADGKGLACQDVGGGFMTFADAHAQFLVLADAAPGCVHGVGSTVLIVGSQDKDRLGIGPGLGSKILAHGDSSL